MALDDGLLPPEQTKPPSRRLQFLLVALVVAAVLAFFFSPRHPPGAEGCFERGRAFAQDGKYAEACDEYARAIEIESGYTEAYRHWADALDKLNRPAEAAEKRARADTLDRERSFAPYLKAEYLVPIAIVVGTSVWVLVDAKRIGVRKGQLSGLLDLDPEGWCLFCLALWIVGFPTYLVKRRELKRISSEWTHLGTE